MRFRLLIALFAVLAASCGGAADPVTSSAPTEAPVSTDGAGTVAGSSEAPVSTSGGQTTQAPTGDAPDRPATDGPAAPAINAILSDGASFSLADEANPVYLVFWAEW